MAALTYLLWLTTREGLRPETAAALVRRFGTAEAAYFADPGEYELLSLSERLAAPWRTSPWSGRSASWATATGWASPC